MNEKIIELETKMAYQEKIIQDLNEVVIGQEKRIQFLESIAREMREQLQQAVNELKEQGRDEKPPHY